MVSIGGSVPDVRVVAVKAGGVKVMSSNLGCGCGNHRISCETLIVDRLCISDIDNGAITFKTEKFVLEHHVTHSSVRPAETVVGADGADGCTGGIPVDRPVGGKGTGISITQRCIESRTTGISIVQRIVWIGSVISCSGGGRIGPGANSSAKLNISAIRSVACGAIR